MRRSYYKNLYQRTRGILWGPVERYAALFGLLVIFSSPLMDSLLEVWEGLPWWIGALLIVLLVFYALARAGYELWKEEQEARKKAEAWSREAEQERDELLTENEELIVETEALMRQPSVGERPESDDESNVAPEQQPSRAFNISESSDVSLLNVDIVGFDEPVRFDRSHGLYTRNSRFYGLESRRRENEEAIRDQVYKRLENQNDEPNSDKERKS